MCQWNKECRLKTQLLNNVQLNIKYKTQILHLNMFPNYKWHRRKSLQ
jgi:hypothetical protein